MHINFTNSIMTVIYRTKSNLTIQTEAEDQSVEMGETTSDQSTNQSPDVMKEQIKPGPSGSKRVREKTTGEEQPSFAASKKKKTDDDECAIVEYLKEKSNRSREKKMTGIEAFFYSMGQIAQSLPVLMQAEIQLEVCRTVTRSQIEYQRKSSEEESKRNMDKMEQDVDEPVNFSMKK